MKGKTVVTLEKVGRMPMPVDVVITYRDGSTETINIPLQIMRGSKPAEAVGQKYRVADSDWPWVNKNYTLEIPVALQTIERMDIDPSLRMADINRENNSWMNK